MEVSVLKKLEWFFTRKYEGATIVLQRKSKTYLYFVLIISAALVMTTGIMLGLSVYGVFSIEFLSRASLIVIGIVGLALLKGGRYYMAANLLVVGAILSTSLQMFLGTHQTELSLFVSIIIPYLFIIAAALLGTRTHGHHRGSC